MSDKDKTPTADVSGLNGGWVTYITPFATALGKSVQEVTDALKPLVGDPDDDTASLLKDEKVTPFEEIKKLLEGVPTAKLRKAVAGLREAPAAASATAPHPVAMTFDVLPQVPADSSWLESLKTSGILKFSKDTVIGTVSAALASRVGLYDLNEKIKEAMEAQAEVLEGPVPMEYLEVRNSLTRRNYSDVFSAIPGGIAQYASEAKKKNLMQRMNSLWADLASFQGTLQGWLDAWQKGMANPAALVNVFAAFAGGGIMPPGMMQPPPTDALRSAAEGVIQSINRIFAGTGSLTAMALAYDAQQIRQLLENPNLPAHVGAANRELMLRQLGVAVSSDYPRLEKNLKQYVLAVVELPNVTSGQTELTYVTTLYQLGAQIPWDKLSGSAPLRPEGSELKRSGGRREFSSF